MREPKRSVDPFFLSLHAALGEMETVEAVSAALGGCRAAWEAGPKRWALEAGWKGPDPDPQLPVKLSERAQALGVRLVRRGDTSYPALLDQIPSAPVGFYLRGREELLQRPGVGIVGSRRPNPYGTLTAERLSGDLAKAGLVIISGGARGIDRAAHEAALKSGGATVAVLGTGVDVVYPRENAKLFDAVARSGCLVSEFPLGAPPLAHHFPRRNRIIAGLSLGVVVVQAKARSGGLITAHLACEFSREVFAVPGRITEELSAGCHHLIQEGAKLVTSAEDVLAELPPVEAQRAVASEAAPNVDEKTAALLNTLSDDPLLFDDIVESVKLPVAELSQMLFFLEMEGLVRQLPGNRYVRVP